MLSCQETLSENREAKKLIEICQAMDPEFAAGNPYVLIKKIFNEVTFSELPPNMSKVALEKKTQVGVWGAYTYSNAIASKIAIHKKSDLD